LEGKPNAQKAIREYSKHLRRFEAGGLVALIHGEFKKSIPDDFWAKVEYPPERDAVSRSLSERKTQLNNEELERMKRQDALDLIRVRAQSAQKELGWRAIVDLQQ